MIREEQTALPTGTEGIEHQGVWAVVVDDEPDFARGLARLLAGRFPDIRVAAVHSGREALAVLAKREVHLLITDLRMPEMSGMQLLESVIARHPDLSVVVLTAHGTIEIAVDAPREAIEAAALAEPNVAAFVAGQAPKKVIVVPGKIVNIVV